MLGEFTPSVINIGADCRTGLQHYYAIGGDKSAFGIFKGQVIQTDERKGYLFKRLSCEFNDSGYYWDDDCAYAEDHVWIFDAKPFKDAGIHVGDSVQFTALAYAYRRQDGTEDFALKCPQDIQKIDTYELPPEPEGLSDEFLGELVCETCMYTDHCYRFFCLAPEGYKEAMINSMKDIMRMEAAK